MKTYYLHTLDGRPAIFDGWKVHYMHATRGQPWVLVSSLAQIKREQQASKRNRKRAFATGVVYGHFRVRLPDSS